MSNHFVLTSAMRPTRERFHKVLGSVAGKRLTWNTLTSQEVG